MTVHSPELHDRHVGNLHEDHVRIKKATQESIISTLALIDDDITKYIQAVPIMCSTQDPSTLHMMTRDIPNGP